MTTHKKQRKSTHKKNNIVSILKTILTKMEDNEPNLCSKTIEACFVDNETIKELNRKYFGRNTVTDILSFRNEFEESNSLGELVINRDFVPDDLIDFEDSRFEIEVGTKPNNCLIENLTDYSSVQHLVKLFIHGTLHLLGHNHIGDKEKKIMEHKEDKYLKLWEKEQTQWS